MKIPVAKEKRFGFLLMTLFYLSSFTLSASEGSHDPSGTWVWDSEFQGETETNSLQVRLEGEALVGEFRRGDVEVTIRSGKSSNEGIEFEIPFQLNNGGEWVITCEATIDGNALSGSYRYERDNGVEESRI